MKQESSKPAAAGICQAEVIASQEMREELLRQILCVLGTVATPSDVGVKGIPVAGAKLLQCRGGLR